MDLFDTKKKKCLYIRIIKVQGLPINYHNIKVLHQVGCYNFDHCHSFSLLWRKTEAERERERERKEKKEKKKIRRNRKMALKLSPFTTQTQKFPSFALPQMGSLRSPKFSMASTLRSNTKFVFLFISFLPNILCVGI